MLTWDDVLPPPALTGRLLYHYTTQEGLLGIAKSRSLWTTSAFHLNDAEEIKHALDLALGELEARLRNECVAKQFHHWVSQNLHPMKRLPVYVGSFSADGDSLSQWRAYTHNGVGFSLGFKDTDLQSLASQQGYRLVKCTYDRQEKDQLISRLIGMCEHIDTQDDPERASLVFCQSLVWIAPTLKSPAFEQEAEWRLISLEGFDPCTATTAFRPGKSMLIPYREFKLEDASGRLPIAEICLGPTPNVVMAEASLKQLVASEPFGSLPTVRVSSVPYRPW